MLGRKMSKENKKIKLGFKFGILFVSCIIGTKSCAFRQSLGKIKFWGHILFCFVLVFWERISQGSPDWLQTHDPPASVSQVLRL
jgi:hypothetical protein